MMVSGCDILIYGMIGKLATGTEIGKTAKLTCAEKRLYA